MVVVQSQLLDIWTDKERAERRRITIREVSKETGLRQETISNLLNNKTTRFDAPVIAKLCAYFGVPDGAPVPFLVVSHQATD